MCQVRESCICPHSNIRTKYSIRQGKENSACFTLQPLLHIYIYCKCSCTLLCTLLLTQPKLEKNEITMDERFQFS